MNAERLAERRKWFRVFPEGTLEFVIITRVFTLLLMIALAVVGGTQRPFVLIGLAGILWLDYVLLLWWVIQVADDLHGATGSDTAAVSPAARAKLGIQAALPSVAAVAAFMPWSKLITVVTGSASPVLAGAISTAAALAFVVLIWPAYRALRSIQLGSPLWTILLLVPLLHFFALHRIASALGGRIQAELGRRGEPEHATQGGSGALIAADITWVLCILPWAVVAAIVLINGWPAGGAFKAGPVCGTMLAATFAITNLAALERVQRQMVALIQKA